MRVISGTARGKKLVSLEGLDTRPTTDRVKESVFNILMPYVRDAKVLDLFAGSGALGIEALSRGASHCAFVENNQDAVAVIRQNLSGTHLEQQSAIFVRDALDFLKNTTESFGIVFLDPPYDGGFYNPVLQLAAERKILSEEGVILLEKRVDTQIIIPGNMELIKERKYGKTVVAVIALRKDEEI